ncbi:MAG: histidine triad nucleotide-binding protein [Candidatus Margulisiibacteriota bacterium]
MSCIFCQIASKTIPAKVVLETDSILAFEDVNPQAPVHVLVIPKQHRASLLDFGQNDATLFGDLMQAIQTVARQTGVAESGFRVVTNTGPDGGQTVDHVHFHVLGRRSLTWPPG